MEKLDDQLLIKILRNVPRTDQLKLFRVSKLWYRLMDEKVGIDLMLGNGFQIWEWHDEEPIEALWDSLEILGKVGVRSCQLNNFLNDSTTPLPKLKHPDLLRFISFNNFVSTSTFKSILSPAKNLHTFEIDWVAMRHLELADVDIEIPCHTLNLYLMEDQSRTQLKMNVKNLEILVINTAYLLRKSFPGLNAFNFCMELSKELYQLLTDEILNFLNNHCGTLKSADICIEPSKYFHDDKYQMTLVQNHSKPITEPGRQFNELRKLQLECPLGQLATDTGSDHWMNWTLQASNLEEIMFAFNFSSSLLKSIMENNSRTLTSIALFPLTLEGWPGSVFDCRVLQNCDTLKILKIKITLSRKRMYWEFLVENTNLLPKSLVKLKIKCLRVSSKSFESIYLNLPNLKELQLVAIGATNEYGVPVQVVREMILRKSITKFHVQTLGNTEDDEVVKKFGFENSPYVLCTLEENGEYARKYETPIIYLSVL